MDFKNLFDAYAYFGDICARNKLAQEHSFRLCRCTGLEGLQEAVDQFRTASAFFCIDDTTDGATFQRGGGFFQRRVFTVFLLKRYMFNNMVSRMEALTICRRLYAQVYSRLLLDSERLLNDYTYLNADRVSFREVADYFLNGCTGLYFMFDVDEPVDLSYEQEEWIE